MKLMALTQMIKMVRLLAVASIAAAGCSAHAQQLFRWTDSEGRVHFSDRAPMDVTKGVDKRTLTKNTSEPTTDYATQQAVKNFPITLYTTSSCGDICAKAKSLLSERGAPFSEVVVGDEATRTRLQQVSSDTQVPVLTVGREVTKGWEPNAYQVALDNAGYPKSRPLAARNGAANQTPTAANAAREEGKGAAPVDKGLAKK
jgi:glutaredoxin